MTSDTKVLNIWSLENLNFGYNISIKPSIDSFNEPDIRNVEKKYANKSKSLLDSKTKKRDIFESKDDQLINNTNIPIERNNIEPTTTVQPTNETFLKEFYVHSNDTSFIESNLENKLHSPYLEMSLNMTDKYYKINNYADKLLKIAHTLHYVGISILAIFVIQVLWKYSDSRLFWVGVEGSEQNFYCVLANRC